MTLTLLLLIALFLPGLVVLIRGIKRHSWVLIGGGIILMLPFSALIILLVLVEFMGS